MYKPQQKTNIDKSPQPIFGFISSLLTQISWMEIVRDPYSGLFLVFEAVENKKTPHV